MKKDKGSKKTARKVKEKVWVWPLDPINPRFRPIVNGFQNNWFSIKQKLCDYRQTFVYLSLSAFFFYSHQNTHSHEHTCMKIHTRTKSTQMCTCVREKVNQTKFSHTHDKRGFGYGWGDGGGGSWCCYYLKCYGYRIVRELINAD